MSRLQGKPDLHFAGTHRIAAVFASLQAIYRACELNADSHAHVVVYSTKLTRGAVLPADLILMLNDVLLQHLQQQLPLPEGGLLPCLYAMMALTTFFVMICSTLREVMVSHL